MTTMPCNSADSPVSPVELLVIARELAHAAGQLMLQRRRAGLAVATKSSATDLVTDADRAVEEFIRAELNRRRPGDIVLGEEFGHVTSPDDEQVAGGVAPVRWIVDPIDGTVNFLLGLPVFSVSIAAQYNGVTLAGCVHNPATGHEFYASAGGGAYLAELRLAGPRVVPLAEAVVATGFGYDPRIRARQGQVVGALLAQVGNLRRLGSAALDLCALAAGWIDCYYEGPLSEWDIAAGLLIAEEAGVATSGLHGRPASATMVAAAHPAMAREFFALLEELGAAQQ